MAPIALIFPIYLHNCFLVHFQGTFFTDYSPTYFSQCNFKLLIGRIFSHSSLTLVMGEKRQIFSEKVGI